MIVTNSNKRWYEDYPKKDFIWFPRRVVSGELVWFHWVWKYIDLWDDYGVIYAYAIEKSDIPKDKVKWTGMR